MNLKPEHLKGYGEVLKCEIDRLDTGYNDIVEILIIHITEGFIDTPEIREELGRVIFQQTDGQFAKTILSEINENNFYVILCHTHA